MWGLMFMSLPPKRDLHKGLHICFSFRKQTKSFMGKSSPPFLDEYLSKLDETEDIDPEIQKTDFSLFTFLGKYIA